MNRAPQQKIGRRLLLRAVRGATTLAFAGVFAFAAIAVGFAAALSFTGILSLAGVGAGVGEGLLDGDACIAGLTGCLSPGCEGTCHQARYGGTGEECFGIHFGFLVFFESLTRGVVSRDFELQK